MRLPGRIVFPSLGLAVFTVTAVAFAFMNPLSAAQRAGVLVVLTLALLWLMALLGSLRRTPEGQDRLRAVPPLALDLLPSLAVVPVAVVIDEMGSRHSEAAWFAGLIAGAVLSVPFSLTIRWFWWERQRRQADRRHALPKPLTPERDRPAGGAELDGPAQ
ncbi:hypothetical protein FDO65_20430 [Nakamurella flava]|uniref:Uncharacterized protein n=1 Tax=Nakamurella flava TaxID=2576308 RepID=A0A4U6Q8Y1_9ACTN|nr:hypothetical protein [Nakamurella flava]TKV56331.1 hypothetical protein FDO65_20430 [Nakamurella flava]